MKDTSENLKLTIIIAKSISMGYKELLAINLTSKGGAMQDDSTLFLQIISAPDIMIAREEMYLHAQVRKFGYFPQETSKTFWHSQLIFEPKVEHIAEQVNS
jgi:hypothetical protein